MRIFNLKPQYSDLDPRTFVQCFYPLSLRAPLAIKAPGLVRGLILEYWISTAPAFLKFLLSQFAILLNLEFYFRFDHNSHRQRRGNQD